MGARLTPDEAEELEHCFRAHARALFGYACMVTRGDRDLAEDLVQQAFRAAAEAWTTLRGLTGEQTSAWLRTTVHHLAVSEFRRNEVARRLLDQVERLYRGPDRDTHRDALTAMALERCWQIVSQMPERQHLISLLHWRCGMKPAEIAELLGIAPGTVAVQIHKARKKLLAGLKERDPFAEDDREPPIRHAREGGAIT